MKITQDFGRKEFPNSWKPKDMTTANNLLDQQLQLCKMLEDKMNAVYHRQDNSYLATFIFQTMDPGFEMLATCRINSLSRQISVTVWLMKNGQKIKVASKAMAVMMCRQFNQQNNYIKYGSLHLNPKTREPCFKLSTLFSKQQYNEYLKHTKMGYEYVIDEAKLGSSYYKYNFYSTLIQIEKLPPKIVKFLQDQKVDFCDRKDLKLKENFQKLNRIVLVAHIRHQFMTIEQVRKVNKYSNEEIMNITENQRKLYRRIEEQIKKLPLDTQRWLEVHHEPYLDFVVPEQINREKKTSYANVLHIKEVKSTSTENNYIFQRIEVCNKEVALKPLVAVSSDETRNQISSHSMANVDFIYKQFKIADITQLGVTYPHLIQQLYSRQFNQVNNRPVSSTNKDLCIKTNADPQETLHQKKILAYLTYNASQYLCKYMWPINDADKLYMEHYPKLSVDRFVGQFSETCSLLTKLYMLQQASHSLRHLHDNFIIHNSVQPKNFLVGKGLTLKITDYTAAYRNKDIHEGYPIKMSPPYSAPQSYGRSEHIFSDKQDVFGFGLTMAEVLFGLKPQLRMTDEQTAQLYLTGQYQRYVSFQPQRLSWYGPIEVQKTTMNLINKCLDPNPQNRPIFEWITLYLQEAIAYINKLL